MTYYLINNFTAKSLLGKGGQGEDLFGYRDFVQFKLFQTYDFNTAGGSTTTTSLNPDGTTTTTTTASQPFSNVFGELEISPSPNLTLRSSLGWSPYTGKMDSQNYNLTLMDKKGNRAYLEYWSTSGDQFRQVNANLVWKINPIWSVSFLTRYSLDQNKNFETTFTCGLHPTMLGGQASLFEYPG